MLFRKAPLKLVHVRNHPRRCTLAAKTLSGITPKRAGEKLGRKKSWLWDRVKNDPTFPRPVYLGPRAPIFIESEIDAYIMKLANARSDRGER